MDNNKPFVLILCGGQSLRLWPLSEYKSKNFMDILGFSPLELTIKRFLKVTTRDNIFLVANINEKKELFKVKSIKKSNIFFEPQSKNTAPAILLSLQHFKKHLKRPLIISPVDSLIDNEKEFYKALDKSLKVADKGWICTLGVKPNESNPNFGYILTEKKVNASGAFKVKRFIEKPGVSLAKKLIRKGNCFYNSGMFIASVGTLIDEYKKYYSYCDDFAKNFSKKKIVSLYRRIKDIPFDKTIMEKTNKIRLIKSSFFWKDFGSWNTIFEVLAKDKNNNVKKGNVYISEGRNNFIYSDNLKKKVLVLGLKDIFFIDTQDYTLIASHSHLDNLKLALKNLKLTT